jgi:hypothetical protein
MFDTVRNAVKFRVERFILRGAHYRLLLIGALIGLISIVGGLLAFSTTTDFSSPAEGIWWAFLRMTDPGYLGDDEGFLLATISTIVTILGYVLFMGSLIAILTQWLDQTIRELESGLTPIAQKSHILILGWTNRTPTIVRELVISEGRVRRFLQRHGVRRLRIVILSDEVTAKHRQDLHDLLGAEWDDRQIIFRSGTPLNIEHLRRVGFLNAASVILPGSELGSGGSDAADMRTMKTLLSVSTMSEGSDLPLMAAEVFDARKIPVARNTYAGRVEIIASDSVISLLIAQNVRHKFLSHVYTELLAHGEGSNEVYIRDWPSFGGSRLQDLGDAFPRAILLGVLRTEEAQVRPVLNPPAGFTLQEDDRLVFIARSYQHTEPLSGDAPHPMDKRTPAKPYRKTQERRILLMGWNDKVPALINEFDSYESERFKMDVLSAIPKDERERKMERYTLQPRQVRLTHLEGDYAAPSDLLRIDPKQYDNVVIVGCDWLPSKEEADARTILGLLLLRDILRGHSKKPQVLVELLDPQNHSIFRHEQEEVLVSPMLVSHVLARVALRPDLNAVFHGLFSSGGAEIVFRPADAYKLVGREVSFRDLQTAVAAEGDTAMGIRMDAESLLPAGGVYLNPDREERWRLQPTDEIVVLTTYA